MVFELVGRRGDSLTSLVIPDRGFQVSLGQVDCIDRSIAPEIQDVGYVHPDAVEGAGPDQMGWNPGLVDEMPVSLLDAAVEWTTEVDDRERVSPPSASSTGEGVAIRCRMSQEHA
ncbi:hypothetical protein Gbro_4902 (plasmid) [Gordonia bronchialis DSM 43247]|uniref:Uncharacterized protein n=1 Tax=Gordonia bronchialis (strain ATCC 25592 / DSM 43247 / BCRC 13721 / JCM 3198 / KCTC 3076 / NBRC 16047 / NCTC 10667) TaxID=526226 RepID=D0LFG6_GORB4|nr:hypothetical protein Gbro_4902 [Gordonia bronchialis DSM 43247]STS10825.1 Uncharacterised protein [Gordonia bronchialis]